MSLKFDVYDTHIVNNKLVISLNNPIQCSRNDLKELYMNKTVVFEGKEYKIVGIESFAMITDIPKGSPIGFMIEETIKENRIENESKSSSHNI